jgi:hypothetical protein
MAKNIKFHVIAISIISVIVIILYLLIGPKSSEQGEAKPSDRFARISSATWGLACNPQIEETQRLQDAIPLAKDADGKVIRVERLQKVTIDNVLPAVKKACEGKLSCVMMAYDDTLGVKLLPGCYRQLNATYRCSDVDRIVSVNIDQGQALRIDCSPNAASAAPQRP